MHSSVACKKTSSRKRDTSLFRICLLGKTTSKNERLLGVQRSRKQFIRSALLLEQFKIKWLSASNQAKSNDAYYTLCTSYHACMLNKYGVKTWKRKRPPALCRLYKAAGVVFRSTISHMQTKPHVRKGWRLFLAKSCPQQLRDGCLNIMGGPPNKPYTDGEAMTQPSCLPFLGA